MSNKTNNSKYVGDCSLSGVAKKAIEVHNKSNIENPLETGNIVIDYAAGQIKSIKAWNTGFNAGKYGFMTKQTYEETCKRKNRTCRNIGEQI